MKNLTLRATSSVKTLAGTESLVVGCICLEKPEFPFRNAFALKRTDSKLAARLMDAINAQKVYVDIEVKTDHEGQSYISARPLVQGRTMNADLKRLGF